MEEKIKLVNEHNLVNEYTYEKILNENDGFNISDHIFVSGCFDILHRGHLNLLFSAEKLGPVFVAVNSDESVYKLKGKYPVLNEENRVSIIASLECVSCVCLINETNAREFVRKHPVKLWLLGDDHKNEDFSDIPCPIAFMSRKQEPYSSQKFKEIINGN